MNRRKTRERIGTAFILIGLLLFAAFIIVPLLWMLSASLRTPMMYCPENPEAARQWRLKWPFLGEDDYGFMMENYGHNGYADHLSNGIGEFTIYDWGNGAASEAVMRVFELDRQ